MHPTEFVFPLSLVSENDCGLHPSESHVDLWKVTTDLDPCSSVSELNRARPSLTGTGLAERDSRFESSSGAFKGKSDPGAQVLRLCKDTGPMRDGRERVPRELRLNHPPVL